MSRSVILAIVGFVAGYIAGTGISYVSLGFVTERGVELVKGTGSGGDWLFAAAKAAVKYDHARDAMRKGNPVKGITRYREFMDKCSGPRITRTLWIFLADAFLCYLLLPVVGSLCAVRLFRGYAGRAN